MTKTARALHDVARRVIQSRQRGDGSAGASAEAIQLCCGELYRALETAMGPAGLQALLARAIHIAAREHAWLGAIKVGTAAAVLTGLTEAAERVEDAETNDGYTALLATMFWLLAQFIGEELTLRFLRQAWPDLTLTTMFEDLRE